ncbi:MAG: tRNA (guanosine(37)-N1)-methyltransferase TrmD [Chloroflexota bacterium]|nr:tRNA (guanosine(37)-N1)-methyltransferase TrmD [Chloroflexota bacterium]MDE2940874.1 tRNA (guanosine(37)-N1)-methyltransferase TrmD [Chloroflexota bacterium]MDE3268425.1 tRNA (guanosine(37)-N1)-methyltransferase TrmD [Chloroflexota bacterium]
MDVHVLTLFPAMLEGPLRESIVGRAVENGVVRIRIHNIRDYAHDRHRTTDDYPYGGGGGMVMKPEPLFEAVEAVRSLIGEENGRERAEGAHVVLMTPQGEVLTQALVEELASKSDLVLICGHYEGVDERVVEHLVDREISIGDYVLSGGEIPAMAVVDAVVRLLPGAVGDGQSIEDDSHSTGLIQFPQYTRPAEYRGRQVPAVLLSGNHEEVRRWRRRQSLRRTQQRRPDLLEKADLSSEDSALLAEQEG